MGIIELYCYVTSDTNKNLCFLVILSDGRRCFFNCRGNRFNILENVGHIEVRLGSLPDRLQDSINNWYREQTGDWYFTPDFPG